MEFLTAEELKMLTGYKQYARQIEKLKEQHYPIQSINKYGMPLVIYKDVFGFNRGNQIPQTIINGWQPPPP